jgi:hypothetical protein
MKRSVIVAVALAVGMTAVGLLAAGLLTGGCKRTWDAKESDREWSRAELRGLQGKTREEVKDLLGEPGGMYTFDSKGRWHFPHVLVREEGEPQARRMSVLVYFSQFGEHRATIIEVLDRWEKERE